MKIIPNRNLKNNPTSLNSAKKNIPLSTLSFSQIIEEHTDEPILESIFSEPDFVLNNISILAEELEKIGQELAEKPLPEIFNKYKKHIRLLLKGVGRNTHIKESTGKSGLTRTKLFRTAQAIDSILADLAQRILNDEKNRIEILKLTNQLQGLVLDIIA